MAAVSEVAVTKGQRLYECFLRIRPMQFAEDDSALGYVPRRTWVELTAQAQWAQADWEKIAEACVQRGTNSGRDLYEQVLRVCPNQRREQTGSLVPRMTWHNLSPHRQQQWDQTARMFWFQSKVLA